MANSRRRNAQPGWVPLCTSLLLLGCGAPAAFDEPKKNVLFVTVDTLRADHLGCYGYRRATSPRIDELAREGVRFEYAIAQWPKTTPSFASMWTSTYAHRNGVTDVRRRIDDRLELLAETFQAEGYRTVGVVTNPNLTAAYNFHQGFDTFVDWTDLGASRAEAVSDFAVEWLETRDDTTPFFLWLHYIDPHTPYDAPAPYGELFVGDPFYVGSERAPLSTERRDGLGGIPPTAFLPRGASVEEAIDRVDYYVAQYDAEIRYADEHVGRLLDALKKLGLEDDTIVVFTSDHGESLGDHGYYFEHGALPYDACLRVPLIVKIPGWSVADSVVDRPVELLDLAPTLVEFLQLRGSERMQGRSLLPLMSGRSDAAADYVFSEGGYSKKYQRVIRNGRWKLIHVPSAFDRGWMQGLPFELYDVATDPGERTNLIEDQPKVAARLESELLRWMESAEPMPGVSASEDVTIDEATREELRTLGYLR